MVKISKYNVQFLILLVCFVGLSGSIVFFPVNLNETHTCLYSKYFCECEKHACLQPKEMVANHANHQVQAQHNHGSDLLKTYIVPFGLLWWGSLLVFSGSIFIIKKSKS